MDSRQPAKLVVQAVDDSFVAIKTVDVDFRENGKSILSSLVLARRPGIFEATGLYVGQSPEVVVKARGYLTERRSVVLLPGDNSQLFVLGKKGMDFYEEGGVRVPYLKSAARLVVLKPDPVAAPHPLLLKFLQKTKTLAPLRQKEGKAPARQSKASKSQAQRRTARPPLAVELAAKGRAPERKKEMTALVRHLRAHPEQGKAALRLKEHAEGGATYFAGEISVTFNVFPTGDALKHFMATHGLHLLNVEGSTIIFDMESPSADFPELVADIRKDPRVKTAEAVLEHALELDIRVVPTDYLFPAQWDHQIIQTPEAWFRLQGAIGANSQFGSGTVILAVADPSGVQGAHPDLTGNINGAAKILATHDFQANTAAITLAGDHGTACATAAAGVANRPALANPNVDEGTAGVAGGVTVVLVRTRIVGDQTQIYLWYSGLSAGGIPAQLNRSVDVTSNSYGKIGPITAPEIWFLDHAADFGRLGRGLVMLYSAGNANTLIVGQRPLAAHPRTICVTAATLLANGTLEGRAGYSNYGPEAGVCALSESIVVGPTVHNPPSAWGAVCGTVTKAAAGATPGLGVLGNMPGFPMLFAGATLTRPTVGATPAGSPRLTLNLTTAPYAPASAVIVEPVGSLNYEPLSLTGINAAAKQLSVSYDAGTPNTQKAHPAGAAVIAGPADYTTSMGGTSYATPVTAGLASLLLSAKSTLSWVEVREILRTTGRKVNVGETNPNGLWYDPAIPGNVTILNPASTDVVPKSPPVTTTLAANVSSPKNPLTHLNHGQSVLPLANAAGFEIGDAIRLRDGVNTDFHVIEDKSGNNITIDALRHDYKTAPATTVKAGKIKPVRSNYYGFGRINASRAVQAAIDYNHADRDLVIRNYLADTGLANINHAVNPIHSPDIWIRNQADPQMPAPPYDKAGQHQNPRSGNNRFIYARIKNIGQRLPNLDAWVHFYVGLSDHAAPPVDPNVNPAPGIGSPFLFPGDPTNAVPAIQQASWCDIQANDISSATGILTNGRNVYHVRNSAVAGAFNQALLAGSINAGDPNNINSGVTVVRIQWNTLDLPPPGTNFSIYLLAYVSPVDGARQGREAGLNNNMSYREIAFAEFHLFDSTGAAPLPSSVNVDEFGTPVVTQFQFNVLQTIGSFTTERVLLEMTRTNDNGSVDRAIFQHNGAAWTLLDQIGGAVTWAHVTPPVVTGTANAAAGSQTTITFAGDFACGLQQQKVVFRGAIHSTRPGAVLVPIAEDSVEILVVAPAPATPFADYSMAKPPEPDSFAFTDFTTVQPQSTGKSYGPIDANHFRVTSAFTATGAQKAFAIAAGVVMVQVVDANRINLVLRPLKQAGLGMTPVKYYIYRGLRLDHFLTPADHSLVRLQAGAPDFVARLWPIHISQNVGPPPFLSVALGFDPANQPDADKIDKFFFATGSSIQFALAKAGEWLGDFFTTGGNEFGLEIVLEEGTSQPTFQNIRRATNIVDVSTLPATNDTERFAKRLAQEEILNFLDPAAFYGMHFNGTVRKNTPGAWTDQDVVTNVVNKFATKDKVYIDIRSENGNSYNFYKNYKGAAAQPDAGKNIKFGATTNSLTTAEYGAQGWPIQITTLAQVIADNNNNLILQLRWADNLKPVLYVEHGEINSETINHRFVDETTLFPPTPQPRLPWTNEIAFQSPNTGAGTKTSIAWLFKLHYGRQIDAATAWPPAVPHTEKTTDNLFGPIDLTPLWSGDAPVRWIAAQDRKYVDGQTPNFGQMMERGVAYEGTAAAGRVIFFAALMDQHRNPILGFIPRRGVTGGTSGSGSFLQVANRFDQYRLEFGSITDGAATVTTLRFKPGSSSEPTVLSGVLFLGITSAEYAKLQALGGLNNAYPRTLYLEELPGPFVGFKKFKLGLQGLKADSTPEKVMPAASSEVVVYSTDSLSFSSDAFAADEPLPTTYVRNVEESIGQMTLEFPKAANFTINSVVTGTNGIFGIAGDLRSLISANGSFQVTGNPNNNGIFKAATVLYSAAADVTGLMVPNVVGPSASGSLQILPRKIEEHFIDSDPGLPIAGTNPMRTIVDAFKAAVVATPADPSAFNLLKAHITTFGTQALARARAAARDNNHANADDRPLYWARLFMQATLKSHPWLLQQFKVRDQLVRQLEDTTRGITPAPSFAGAGAKKRVLLLGFDPFFVVPGQAGNNSHQSNPSGVAALYLHANTAAIPNMVFQCVILPVRFEDFDQGIVDNLVGAYFQGPNRADLILSLSQDVDLLFHVDRFATRFRTPSVKDNLNVTNKTPVHYELNTAQTGLEPLATNANLPQYLETTLPVNRMVPGAAMSVAATGTQIVKTVRFDQKFKLTGLAQSGTEDNQGMFSGLVPTAGVEVEEGSGGNYLFNELFYRICWQRAQRTTTLKTGHLHVPKLQTDAAGAKPFFDPDRVRYFLDTLTQILKDTLQGL